MRPDQEMSLVGGGDCFLHFHSEDRQPSRDMLEGLQNLATVVTVNADYSASLSTDYHLVNTSSGVVNVALTKARGNRLTTFVKTAGGSNLVLTPTAPDTINGASSLIISSIYSPVRLLAIQGVGYVQV